MRTMTRKAMSQLCIGLVGLPLVLAGMAMNARLQQFIMRSISRFLATISAELGSDRIMSRIGQTRLSRSLPQQTRAPNI